MIAYSSGYKYRLDQEYSVGTVIKPLKPAIIGNFVCLDTRGLLTISRGYAWDGASGPAIDTRNVMRASLVHDALYQLMREEKLDLSWFSAANAEFHRLLIEDGVSWFRAWYMHRAVELFGMYSVLK